MLEQFYMNGRKWKVRFTHPDNPILIDRTGTMTCAVTDGSTRIIWVSNAISGDFLTRVVLHELSHAMMFSNGFVTELHKLVPKENWIEIEEMIANLIADKAKEIFEIAYEIVGDEAIHFVPYFLERSA